MLQHVGTGITAMLLALLLGACGEGSSPGQAPVEPRFTTFALGESSLDTGDYVIHFNAFTTDQLSPEVAQRYQIARSQNRVMLNVTVVKKRPDASPRAVSASLGANVANLSGQRKNVQFREIAEGDAIYYVAELSVTSGETLMFEIEVTPEGESQTHYLKFRRSFNF